MMLIQSAFQKAQRLRKPWLKKQMEKACHGQRGRQVREKGRKQTHGHGLGSGGYSRNGRRISWLILLPSV